MVAEMTMRLLILCVLALTSCTSAAEKHHAECLSYGLAQGTDGYAACRFALKQDQLNRAALLGSTGQFLIGQSYRPRTTVTCTTHGITTTCF